MLRYRFLAWVHQWGDDGSPQLTVTQIAGNMGEEFDETLNAIQTCAKLGWVNCVDRRHYVTIEGDRALARAVENSTTVTAMSVQKHRSESLTGLREHTRKKQAVTSRTKLTNAVLPKSGLSYETKIAIEDALDICFRIRRIAEEKGKTIDEIIMEEFG